MANLKGPLAKKKQKAKKEQKFFIHLEKHKILLFVILMASVLLAGFAWAQKTVTLDVGGEEQKVKTFALTVGQLLQAEEIEIGEHDRLVPGPEEFLQNKMTVTVTRAVPVKIKIGENMVDTNDTNDTNDKENIQEIYTLGATIQELIDEQEIKLEGEDFTLPQLDEPVKPDMTVQVIRQQTETWEEEVRIPHGITNRDAPQLSRGTTRVVQEGRQGIEKKVWKITYRNGAEFKRELESTEVTRRPVKRIVDLGTAQPQQVVSRGGQDMRYSRAMDMVATAYTYTGNNTASGVPPRRGVAAVDTGVIPMGTRLYVDGYGYCTALDRGSAIRGGKIDLFMESSQEARQWGVRKVKVYVLE